MLGGGKDGEGRRDSAVIEELRVCVWFGVRLEWDWVGAAESGFWETWREGGVMRVIKGVSIVLSISWVGLSRDLDTPVNLIAYPLLCPTCSRGKMIR